MLSQSGREASGRFLHFLQSKDSLKTAFCLQIASFLKGYAVDLRNIGLADKFRIFSKHLQSTLRKYFSTSVLKASSSSFALIETG